MQERDADSQVARLEAILTRLELFAKVLEERAKRHEPAVWTVADIAEWLKLSEYTIKTAVIVRPGFPEAIQATGAKEGQKRWFADEVIDWVRKSRGKLPTGRRGGRPRLR